MAGERHFGERCVKAVGERGGGEEEWGEEGASVTSGHPGTLDRVWKTAQPSQQRHIQLTNGFWVGKY